MITINIIHWVKICQAMKASSTRPHALFDTDGYNLWIFPILLIENR